MGGLYSSYSKVPNIAKKRSIMAKDTVGATHISPLFGAPVSFGGGSAGSGTRAPVGTDAPTATGTAAGDGALAGAGVAVTGMSRDPLSGIWVLLIATLPK